MTDMLFLPIALFTRSVISSSVVLSMDNAWRFSLKGHAPLPPGGECNASLFPINYSSVQCMGLHPEAQYADPDGCRSGCCQDPSCEVYQWCIGSNKDCDGSSCWLGKANDCNHKPSSKIRFISFGRKVAPSPSPGPTPSGSHCTASWCMVNTDDRNWRLLDHLPHDFVVEGNVSASASDKSHGFKPYGVGYYRKHFDAPEASANLPAQWLTFDGVQRDSDTYLNGELLGHHDSGYTNFRFDVSGKLLPKNNVLAVKADATHPDGWWYDGGGIYRHVWLELAPAVHFAPDGIFANITVPKVVSGGLKGDAVIDAQAEILNSGNADASDVIVTFSVVDTSGKEVCTTSTPAPSTHVPATPGGAIQYNTSTLVRAELECADINLWSDIHSVLYSLKAMISVGGQPGGDSRTVTIGFRRIYFDSEKGLLLNDIPTKIRGLANHQDFAGVGVAVPDSLQAFRISKLKEMGANGWRCAHNPPTPALLDEADKQGFLVWDENHRNLVDGGQWIEDLHALLRRDRNHPSVVLWSLCNEALCEGFNADHAKVLYPIVKSFDNGPNARPVTAAMNGGYGDDFSKVLDIVGINYHASGYEGFHKQMGAITGSETASALSDRGEYYTNATAAYMSAYDTNKPGWGQTAEVAWQSVDKYDFVSATFIWTGFDYKGEPTPYSWPNVNSHFGIIDIAGFPKDSFFYYKSQWRADLVGTKSVVHMLPHWNWGNPAKCAGLCQSVRANSTGATATSVDVWAYGGPDIASMDLVVNGKTVGSKTALPKLGHVEWKAVPYEPGTATCNGYDASGKLLSSHVVKTANAPVALTATIEQGAKGVLANKDDVILVKIAVVDHAGTTHPTADNMITFSVTGPGVVIGVGNGDPSSHEPDKGVQRSAWNGLARVVVQTTDKPGAITITASSPGLKSASVTVSSKTPSHRLSYV